MKQVVLNFRAGFAGLREGFEALGRAGCRLAGERGTVRRGFRRQARKLGRTLGCCARIGLSGRTRCIGRDAGAGGVSLGRVLLGQQGRDALPRARAEGGVPHRARIEIGPFGIRTFFRDSSGMPACGGFLLSDTRRQASEDFAADEWAEYRDLDDCVSMVRHFLGGFGEACAIAERAQVRVARDHCYRNRVARLLDFARHAE